ncbi:MAG: hypothetical protein KME01_13445 [Chroococcus sp. CMT-3BRIN-NPC107]|nr:hypothetical protein [Chroococcus sp. CMT-3BRIN-NPC107]
MPENFSNKSNSQEDVALSSRKPYSKILLRLVLAVALLITAFPLLYEFKSRVGIDIVSGVHAGTFLEKHSRGLIKCQWLYPYHCPSDRMT